MNIVNIKNNYKNYKIDDYDRMICETESIYLVDKEYLDYIDDISGDNSKKAYYITYLIVKDNVIEPDIETPKRGLTFFDRSGELSKIGIYHAHLDETNILIWYLIKNEYGDLILRSIYMKHPDRYESILKDIMNSPNGYDIIRNEYFKNYKKQYIFKRE